MKQLRAEGIKKLLDALGEDCQHIQRLGRDSAQLEDHLANALEDIDGARFLLAELLEERTSVQT